MIEVATAINSFASQAKQVDFVPPSEEPVFILTSGQLQDLITRAIEPLQDRIESLEGVLTKQGEEIAALKATAKHQEDNQFIQLQLISQLREAVKKEPQPLQRDRGDILKALLAANGGKMLAKDARQKMHISRSHFSELLTTMQGNIEVKPYHLRKNQRVLVLK